MACWAKAGRVSPYPTLGWPQSNICIYKPLHTHLFLRVGMCPSYVKIELVMADTRCL